MNRDEWKDVAELWTDETSTSEAALVEALAPRAAARARLIQRSELAVSLLLAVAVVGAVVLRPGPAVWLTGGAVLLALAWSSWRRHQLATLSLLIDRSGRRTFIESAFAAKQAQVRRSRIGLVLLFPGSLAALLLVDTLRGGSLLRDPASAAATLFDSGGDFVAPLLLVALALHLIRSHRALTRELGRLEELAAAYVHEDAEAAASHAHLLPPGNSSQDP